MRWRGLFFARRKATAKNPAIVARPLAAEGRYENDRIDRLILHSHHESAFLRIRSVAKAR